MSRSLLRVEPMPDRRFSGTRHATNARHPPRWVMSRAPSAAKPSQMKPLAQVPSASSTLPSPRRCRDAGQEAAHLVQRQRPDLHLDGRPTLGLADQTGPMGRPPRQGIQPVTRGRASSAEQAPAPLGELAVEGQPGQVGPTDHQGQATGLVGRQLGGGGPGCQSRGPQGGARGQRPGVPPRTARPTVAEGRAEQGHAEGQAIGGKPAGTATAARSSRFMKLV